MTFIPYGPEKTLSVHAGDRVRIVYDSVYIPYGTKATVVYAYSKYDIGLCLDDSVSYAHALGGRVPNGHGWLVSEQSIERIEEDVADYDGVPSLDGLL